jgi:hypothetical protein
MLPAVFALPAFSFPPELAAWLAASVEAQPVSPPQADVAQERVSPPQADAAQERVSPPEQPDAVAAEAWPAWVELPVGDWVGARVSLARADSAERQRGDSVVALASAAQLVDEVEPVPRDARAVAWPQARERVEPVLLRKQVVRVVPPVAPVRVVRA